MALVALAHDPSAGGEIVHGSFPRDQGPRGVIGSCQDVDGCEGVEELGNGGDHGRLFSQDESVASKSQHNLN